MGSQGSEVKGHRGWVEVGRQGARGWGIYGAIYGAMEGDLWGTRRDLWGEGGSMGRWYAVYGALYGVGLGNPWGSCGAIYGAA